MVSNLLVLSLLVLFPSHCFIAPAYQRLSVPADDAVKPALSYGEPIAQYKFDGDASDSLGRNADIHLRKTGFINGSLYLSGVYLFATAESPGYFAAAEIRDLDPQSFTISLDFYPLDFAKKNIVAGGVKYRWFSFRCSGGKLELTLNNQEFVHTFGDTHLEVNKWQNIVCSFDIKAGIIRTFLSGKELEPIKLLEGFELNAPYNRTEILGAMYQDDKVITFSNFSNGQAFHGYVDNLEVYNSPVKWES